ncbi:hypothetical protein P3342_009630 [Pyrenophora teres f. teres]|nr:hypothetical protein HRS9139_08746 [Pyrenophora teres f. teres]KAE8834733.1 hypothetical protein PTNB85_06066 [Pyrenophora teres f. teres]KAE8843789.1 hypothetical protein HRS9122_04892 [Pyrenophora teres f. teres]KAE8861019.1 hypothetical protein PTNB29_06114 [Pyrenophora teres f. teres]KAK1908779.1 hypothetical protein P3342_009630 [Pyrenophora teres f. teres]
MELFLNLRFSPSRKSRPEKPVNAPKTYQFPPQKEMEVKCTANYAMVRTRFPGWSPPTPGSFSDDHAEPESPESEPVPLPKQASSIQNSPSNRTEVDTQTRSLSPQLSDRKKKRSQFSRAGPQPKRRQLENVPATQFNEPFWKGEFGIHPSLEPKLDLLPEPIRLVPIRHLSDEVFERRLKRNIPPPPSIFSSVSVAARVKVVPRKQKVVEVEEDECEEVREAFWQSYIQQLVEAEEEKEKQAEPEEHMEPGEQEDMEEWQEDQSESDVRQRTDAKIASPGSLETPPPDVVYPSLPPSPELRDDTATLSPNPSEIH